MAVSTEAWRPFRRARALLPKLLVQNRRLKADASMFVSPQALSFQPTAWMSWLSGAEIHRSDTTFRHITVKATKQRKIQQSILQHMTRARSACKGSSQQQPILSQIQLARALLPRVGVRLGVPGPAMPKKARKLRLRPRSKLPNDTASVKAETFGLVQASHEANSVNLNDCTIDVHEKIEALGLTHPNIEANSSATRVEPAKDQSSPSGSQPRTIENSQASKWQMDESITDAAATPLADIRTSWTRVAGKALLALSCIIPGTSILIMFIMFYLCVAKKWRMLELPLVHQVSREGAWFLCFEAYMWIMLLSDAHVDIIYLVTYVLAFEEGIKLRPVVEQIQLQQMSQLLQFGSVFLWRILAIHIIEVSAEVHSHKKAAFEKLRVDMQKIAKVLDWSVPAKEDLPQKLHEVNKFRRTKWGLDLFVIVSSALVVLGGMLFSYLQAFQKRTTSHELNVALARVNAAISSWNFNATAASTQSTPSQTDTSWLFVFSSIVNAALISLRWYWALACVFVSTRLIMKNRDQLLLFSALSSASQEQLNDVEGRSARKLREQAYVLAEEQGEGRDLFAPLDLGKAVTAEDVKAWFMLRKFIQVDFADESAIMDACGIIVIVLILGLLLCGIVEWSLHGQLLSLVFLMICTLILVLTFALYRVFDVCIEMNSIMDRDMLLVTDAMLEAVCRQNDEWQKVLAALQVIERKLNFYDGKQKLLGLTVTANLRNGWIASLVVALLSWGSRYMTPVMSHLDVDRLQEMFKQYGLGSESEPS